MRIAQVALIVCFIDAARDRFGVIADGEYLLSFIPDGDRRAGILTTRQDSTGGDVGIPKQFQRDETIIVRGFRIVQNVAQLLQVIRSQ